MKTDSLFCSRLSLALVAAATLCACGTEDRSAPSPASNGAEPAAGEDAAGVLGDSAVLGDSSVLGDSAVTSDAEQLAVDLALAEPAAAPGPEPVRWRACGHVEDRDISCAEVYVPLDHADPGGEQIAISLNRVSANRVYPPRGVLLFNPGGPGASGIESVVGVAVSGLGDLASISSALIHAAWP
jgi:hypothetical protein